jgi:hypothetical protein
MTSLTLPPGYDRIKVVRSFEDLVSARFEDGVNAISWPRELSGDYREVVERLGLGVGITTIEEGRLEALLSGEGSLSEAGRVAVEVMREDLRRLRELGLEPVLDGVNGYAPRGAEGGDEEMDAGEAVVRTDVCSWHVDSATCEADTWLCTYFGRSSEGLRSEEAIRRVDVPETRAELLRCYGGEDDEGFLEYLNDHYYDLHYVPVEGARGWSFGAGNLWRVATAYPGCAVPACIHRAPDPVAGELPRLLLIS